MYPIGNPIAAIYDDHLLFAESFSAVLERLGLFQSVHIFNDEQAYLRFLVKRFNEPIYSFLDYYLPKKNTLSLINETRRINKKSRVIIVSSVTTPSIIKHILAFDPDGFLSKSSGLDIVLDCLKTIKQSKPYMCPVIQEIITNEIKTDNNIPFTARELEMLQFFAQGLSIIDTANVTHLSKHTIVSHRRKMMEKVNARSITELLAYARAHELI